MQGYGVSLRLPACPPLVDTSLNLSWPGTCLMLNGLFTYPLHVH